MKDRESRPPDQINMAGMLSSGQLRDTLRHEWCSQRQDDGRQALQGPLTQDRHWTRSSHRQPCSLKAQPDAEVWLCAYTKQPLQPLSKSNLALCLSTQQASWPQPCAAIIPAICSTSKQTAVRDAHDLAAEDSINSAVQPLFPLDMGPCWSARKRWVSVPGSIAISSQDASSRAAVHLRRPLTSWSWVGAAGGFPLSGSSPAGRCKPVHTQIRSYNPMGTL